MSKTKRIVTEAGIYSSATLIKQAVTLVMALVTRYFLGPFQVGVWSIIQVVLAYSEYTMLGITDVIPREIPFYNGKGMTEKADEIKNTAFSFSFFSSAVVAGGILTFVVWKRDTLAREVLCALLFAAGLVFLQRFNDLLISLLRAYREFELAGRQMVWSSVVNGALILALAYPFKLYGFMAAMCLSFCFNIGYIFFRYNFHFRFRLKTAETAPLVAFGLPLMTLSLIATFFTTVDKILITKYLGLEALGLYSIALMTAAYIFSFPVSVGVVMVSNLHETYGETGDRQSLKGFLSKSTAVYCVLLPMLIGLSWFAVPGLVHYLLPKFADGIGALRALTLGTFFFALSQPYSNFVVAIRRHWALIPVMLFCTAVAGILIYTAVDRGWGITGVGAAMSLAFFVHFSLVFVMAAIALGTRMSGVRDFFGILCNFAFMVAALCLIDTIIAMPSFFWKSFLQTILFLLIYVPFMLRLNRQFALFETLKGPMRNLFRLSRPAKGAE